LFPAAATLHQLRARVKLHATHLNELDCLFKQGARRRVWVARWREWMIGKDGSRRGVLRSAVLGTVADIPTKREAGKLLERYLFPNVPKFAQPWCKLQLAEQGVTQ